MPCGPFWVAGPFADQVDPMWVQTPAPYGPLALQVQHLVVSVFPENAYVSAVAMRVPALLAVGLLAYALPRLAERYGVSGRHALWLGVLNPLVMMHFIGGAHGDAVMVALVTLALLLASRGQLVVASMTIAAAAAYKQTAVLALIGVVGMALQAQSDLEPGARARLRAMVRHASSTAGSPRRPSPPSPPCPASAGAGSPTCPSPSRCARCSRPRPSSAAPSSGSCASVACPRAWSLPVPIAQTIGLVVGLAGIAWITWRFAPRNPVLATAGALLVLCASGPVIHPWYLLSGRPAARRRAPVGEARARRRLRDALLRHLRRRRRDGLQRHVGPRRLGSTVDGRAAARQPPTRARAVRRARARRRPAAPLTDDGPADLGLGPVSRVVLR